MLTEDNILKIGSVDFNQSWSMTLDLNVIAKEAGVKKKETAWTDPKTGVRYEGYTFVMLPLPQARRIINMILQYATICELEKVDEIFRKNPKLYKIWKEKLNASKRIY